MYHVGNDGVCVFIVIMSVFVPARKNWLKGN